MAAYPLARRTARPVNALKARVHLVLTLPEQDPFSYRTDVLALTRDPQWVYDEALGCAIRSLLAVKQPAHRVKVELCSIEWVPTGRP